MTSASSNAFIDPSLSDAIRHWNEYSAESAQNALVVFSAITPVKDTVEVTQQVIESMQDSNWIPVSTKLMDPTILSGACSELTDIQMAAMSKLFDGYTEFLKTTREATEQLTVARKADSAQQLLASYLETSLNTLKQYQADASDQASALNTVQSAYKAWFQKTLEAFSGR